MAAFDGDSPQRRYRAWPEIRSLPRRSSRPAPPTKALWVGVTSEGRSLKTRYAPPADMNGLSRGIGNRHLARYGISQELDLTCVSTPPAFARKVSLPRYSPLPSMAKPNGSLSSATGPTR